METDERFTRRDKFMSSDYLLNRVGYDPARVHKRLGDGFYEQRLVRMQMQALAGTLSSRGEEAMEQYQQLMNAGSKVAQDFNLVPGVALTPEQTAALQQDIVWLVSETVDTLDGPQTVWVPKVYLAPTTLRLTRDGAVIGGGNLQLSAGSVANAGNLFADKALTVETGHFRHQRGDIRAGSIQVQANSLTMSTHLQDALRRAAMRAGDINLSGGDIHLHGAKLDATQNLSLSARHNLAILAVKSSHTAHLTLISGATGNRTFDGMEDAGARMARVSGEWQQALGSELNAGGNVSLAAGRDITAQGSQVTAAGAARGLAEGDINFKAATTTNNTHLKANSRTSSISSRRQEERLLLSTLSADKGVALVAGNHLLAEGAQIDSAAGRIGVSAQDVTIKDARARIADKNSEQKRQGLTTSRRVIEINREISTGSTFSGQQGVTIVGREGDITFTGSVLHSEQGAIGLRAKKDVILDSATERDSQYSVERSNSKGFLSKSSSLTVTNDRSIRERGALLSGERVTVTAGNDLTVKGSAIAADRDISLQAGNNVDIIAATESETHFLLEEKKKSGLLGSGGIGFTLGSQSSRHQVDEKGTTQSLSVSTVGSSQGNVSITAGNRLYVGGADLVAAKDLTLAGDSVTIDPGYDERSRTEIVASKQSGLSVALSGTAGSAFNTAVNSAQQARNESDSRLAALQRAKAALSGVQAAQGYARDNALSNAADAQNAAAGLQAGAKDAARGATNTVGFTASYGSQSSRSESRTESRQSQGSTLTAGKSLSITAAGKNNIAGSGDIVVTGSTLTAGMDLKLDAARDITLQSAQNIENTVGHNSSEGGHVGVGIGAGSGGYGISVSVGVNVGQGHEKGRGLTHTETTLDAGRRLTLSSGRDSTLKGAQARGGTITLDVGRDLLLQSAQDSDRYDAKQQDATAGGSFTFGSMTGSTYVSASQDKLQSHFDGVKAQTGLFAGAGGYNVQVQAHSQLDGAVIASQAGKGHNRLDTGTLGWRDIHNQAAFKAEHSGGSFSTGGPVGKDLLTNMAGGMLSGANNSRHDEGTTQSRISEGTLIIHDQGRQQQDVAQLKRETGLGNAGSISPLFDKEKEQSRLKQAQLIGNLGAQAMDLIRTQGDIAGLKAHKDPTALSQAREQLQRDGKPFSDAAVMQRAYNSAMAQYGTGSDLQKAAQAVTGALTALAGNNLAGALASGASPYLATEIKHLTTHPLTGKADVNANAMAHALLGALTAQLNHQSAVAGGLGAGVGELAAGVIADRLLAGKTLEQLSASEKQQVSALSQLAAGLAGGLVTGDAGGAVTAAQTGKNAVENNCLNRDEASEKTSLTYKLQHGQQSGSEKGQAEARLEQLNETDKARDQAIKNICQSGSKGSKGSVGCRALVGPAEKALKEYSSNVSYSLLYKDLYPQDAKNLEKVLRGLDTGALVRDQAITAIAKESGVSWEIAASRYDRAMVAQTIAATLGSVFAIKAIFLDGATTGTNQVNLPVKPHGFSTKMDNPVQKSTKTPPSIKSMQVGLREPQQVDQLKNDMLNGMYEFTAPKGRIAGWIDSKGNYYVSEGNHRMAAAQEIYKKTGDTSFIERLLKNGLWTQSEDAPAGAKSMPSRGFVE